MKQEYKTFASKLTKRKAIAKKNYYADELEKKQEQFVRNTVAASNVTSHKISEIIKFAHFNTRKRKENIRKQSILEEFNEYFFNIGKI